MMPQSRIVDLGSNRPTVEILHAGEGAPLLFLHGAGGVPTWDGVLPALSKEFHVYAPLLPGFGGSTGLEYLDDQWDLFLHGFDVIDALGLERPYVVGESIGGWLATEMAALRPKEIGRLALTRADENREVALIMLRDAHNLPPGLLDAQHTKNFELTYESAARGLRDLQAAQGSDATIDADALGYLFLAPSIYFRLIEWATNRRILDLDDERLLAAWTSVFAPVFTSLRAEPPEQLDA